mgnify:CR=1 FL=1
MSNHDIPVKEISELFDVLSKKAPEVINQLLKSVYSPEAGVNMGRSVGNFYKELIDAGIPQDVAIKMSRDYMLSIRDAMKTMNFHDGGCCDGERHDGR